MRTFDEKIMADARNNPCIRCGSEEGVYGRHYNGQRQHHFGKGRGRKGHGMMVADFCAACDRFFQEGSIPKHDRFPAADDAARDKYSEDFMFWCVMSQIRRVDNGVIS